MDHPKKEMSRGAMTAWIAGSILLVGAIIAFMLASETDPNDPYAKCDNIFGHRDVACAGEIGRRRLMGLE